MWNQICIAPFTKRVLLVAAGLILASTAVADNSGQAQGEKEIRQIVEDWFAAENRKDLDATVGFLADNIVYQVVGIPEIRGKESAREVFGPFLESLVSIGGDTSVVSISASGDMAYGVGSNRVTMRDPHGIEITSVGKWFIVWQKIDESWKAVAMSASGDSAL